MSNIVTDNLLCQYIVDSGKLTESEVAAVREYLAANPSELEMVADISESMMECNMALDNNLFSHSTTCPFSDEEFAVRRAENKGRALELLDDILIPRTEQELLTHFGTDAKEECKPSRIIISLDDESEEIATSQELKLNR